MAQKTPLGDLSAMLKFVFWVGSLIHNLPPGLKEKEDNKKLFLGVLLFGAGSGRAYLGLVKENHQRKCFRPQNFHIKLGIFFLSI